MTRSEIDKSMKKGHRVSLGDCSDAGRGKTLADGEFNEMTKEQGNETIQR